MQRTIPLSHYTVLQTFCVNWLLLKQKLELCFSRKTPVSAVAGLSMCDLVQVQCFFFAK